MLWRPHARTLAAAATLTLPAVVFAELAQIVGATSFLLTAKVLIISAAILLGVSPIVLVLDWSGWVERRYPSMALGSPIADGHRRGLVRWAVTYYTATVVVYLAALAVIAVTVRTSETLYLVAPLYTGSLLCGGLALSAHMRLWVLERRAGPRVAKRSS